MSTIFERKMKNIHENQQKVSYYNVNNPHDMLTPEILEANGFTWEYGQDSTNFQWFENKDLEFSIKFSRSTGNFYNYVGKQIRTVKELCDLYKAVFYKPLKLKKI